MVSIVWWKRNGGLIKLLYIFVGTAGSFLVCSLFKISVSWIFSCISRWFSADGLGYLSPLSITSLVSNVMNIDPIQLLSKLMAGGCTAVMATAFGCPLIFALVIYVLPFADIGDADERRDDTVDLPSVHVGRIQNPRAGSARPFSECGDGIWICTVCFCENLPDASVCIMCQIENPLTTPRSTIHEAEVGTGSWPRGTLARNENEEMSALIPELSLLPFESLEVLCVLGSGITSTVLLARFSLERMLQREEEGSFLSPYAPEATKQCQKMGQTCLHLSKPSAGERPDMLFLDDDEDGKIDLGTQLDVLSAQVRTSANASSFHCWKQDHNRSLRGKGVNPSSKNPNEKPHKQMLCCTPLYMPEPAFQQSMDGIGSHTCSSHLSSKLSEDGNHNFGARRNKWRPLQWLDEAECESQGVDPGYALLDEGIRLVPVPSFASLASRASSVTSLDTILDSTWPESGVSVDGGASLSVCSPPHCLQSPELRYSSQKSAMSTSEDATSKDANNVIGLLQQKGQQIWRTSRNGRFGSWDATISLPPLPLELCPSLVAIKRVHKSRVEKLRLRSSVECELIALRRCANGSPFVCTLFGAFQDHRWAYLVLEPMPAGDLAGLLEQRGLMFEEEARFCMGCVLLALEHLHRHSVACLDLKPENLLLDQWGYLKLCDLGIAKCIDSMSNARGSQGNDKKCDRWEFVGTPEYMAPEVIARERRAVGIAGVAGPDLWSAGVLMYECLVGEPPFVGEDDGSSAADATLNLIMQFAAEERRAVKACRKMQRQCWRWSRRCSTGLGSDDSEELYTEDGTLFDGGDGHVRNRCGAIDEFSLLTFPDRSISDAAREMIRSLLQPEPKHRLGCREPSRRQLTKNYVGVSDYPETATRRVMQHTWFADNSDFSSVATRIAAVDRDFWNPLRSRRLRAPFVPHPATLPPPFRFKKENGIEQVVQPDDITRRPPLTLAQLQACEDLLEQNSVEGASSANNTLPKNHSTTAPLMWQGFVWANRVPIPANELCEPHASHDNISIPRRSASNKYDMRVHAYDDSGGNYAKTSTIEHAICLLRRKTCFI